MFNLGIDSPKGELQITKKNCSTEKLKGKKKIDLWQDKKRFHQKHYLNKEVGKKNHLYIRLKT